MERALSLDLLPGNLRDLQRLAPAGVRVEPRRVGRDLRRRARPRRVAGDRHDAYLAHRSWAGSRKERIQALQVRLALWAKDTWGTWGAAAKELACDEKRCVRMLMTEPHFTANAADP